MSGKTTARAKGGIVKKVVAAAASAAMMLLLLLLPGPALSGARRGLLLCGESVVPSLFPFLVLSSFVIGSGLADACGKLLRTVTARLFRLPGCAGVAVILGAVGGYPVGADAVAKLRLEGALTKGEAERLLCFVINSSPAFIIGAVGAGFLGSAEAGMLLYAAHLAASLTLGLAVGALSKRPGRTAGRHTAGRRTAIRAAVRPSEGHPGPRRARGGLSGAFVAAVTGAAASIITICAYVVLFSSFNALCESTGLTSALTRAASALPNFGDPQFYRRAFSGILEVTNGCAAAAGAGGLAAVLLTAAVLGFSGLSVQFQVISLISKADLSARLFILTRPVHMALSVLYAWGLFSLIPGALPTARVEAIAIGGAVVAFHSAPAVCAMLFICAMLLLSLASV